MLELALSALLDDDGGRGEGVKLKLNSVSTASSHAVLNTQEMQMAEIVVTAAVVVDNEMELMSR